MSPVTKKHRLLFFGFAPSDQVRMQGVFGDRLLAFLSPAEAACIDPHAGTVEAVFIHHCPEDELGFALLRKLKIAAASIPTICITPPGDEATLQNALQHGADECLAGGEDCFEKLPGALARALARKTFRRSAIALSETIMQSRQEWLTIIDAIMDCIFITDNSCTLVKMNQAFASLFDTHPKSLIGSKCLELFGKENPCRGCVMHVSGKHHAPNTTENIVKGELYQVSTFPLHTDGRPLTIHVMKNISEMKKLKDLLYYSDKLASLGLLVGGVAHEINNPLTGIIGYAELLRLKPGAESMDAELKKVLEGAERCRKIVENLLTFARQKAPTRNNESINNIIDRAIDLRTYWLRTNNIVIEKHYEEPSTVFVDAQQIQLVMLNILLNAEQAIVETGRGTGRVLFATHFDPVTRTVTVTVSDNGPGIPKENLGKVFDPFFTTKPVGVGTGLGLSIAHGIITEHGGAMRVESTEGKGTTMIIDIPTGAQTVFVSPIAGGQNAPGKACK